MPSTQRGVAALHTVPQEPQLLGSCRRSRHCPLHRVSPGRQVQAEERHAWLAVQPVPHELQLSGLFCRSAQTLLLHSVPLQEHVPAVQVSPCGQALAQLPQWLGSVARSVHTVPHMTFPAGQVHAPLTHESPVGHALIHDPQWFGSFAVSTHPTSPPQLTSPAGQLHTPALKTAPGGHWLPHAPQLSGSVDVSTHPSPTPQLVSPAGQVHTPLTHDAPAGHTWPHDPQLTGSFDGSTHIALQTIGQIVVVVVVVVGVVVEVLPDDVVLVVVVPPPTFSSPLRSVVKASTLFSIAVESPVVLQPGFASSLAYAALTLAWHFASFAGSMVPPAAATFDWRPATHDAFLPASLIFAPWHLF